MELQEKEGDKKHTANLIKNSPKMPINPLTSCVHWKVIHTQANLQISAAGFFKYA